MFPIHTPPHPIDSFANHQLTLGKTIDLKMSTSYNHPRVGSNRPRVNIRRKVGDEMNIAQQQLAQQQPTQQLAAQVAHEQAQQGFPLMVTYRHAVIHYAPTSEPRLAVHGPTLRRLVMASWEFPLPPAALPAQHRPRRGRPSRARIDGVHRHAVVYYRETGEPAAVVCDELIGTGQAGGGGQVGGGGGQMGEPAHTTGSVPIQRIDRTCVPRRTHHLGTIRVDPLSGPRVAPLASQVACPTESASGSESVSGDDSADSAADDESDTEELEWPIPVTRVTAADESSIPDTLPLTPDASWSSDDLLSIPDVPLPREPEPTQPMPTQPMSTQPAAQRCVAIGPVTPTSPTMTVDKKAMASALRKDRPTRKDNIGVVRNIGLAKGSKAHRASVKAARRHAMTQGQFVSSLIAQVRAGRGLDEAVEGVKKAMAM